MPDHELSPGEAARILGVTSQTVRLYAKKGKLTVKLSPGKHRRYSLEEIERLQAEAKAEPETAA